MSKSEKLESEMAESSTWITLGYEREVDNEPVESDVSTCL